MILLSILCVRYGDSKPIRIMSFNVWLSGRSVLDGVEKIIRHIRDVDADVVAMQVSARGFASSLKNESEIHHESKRCPSHNRFQPSKYMNT